MCGKVVLSPRNFPVNHSCGSKFIDLSNSRDDSFVDACLVGEKEEDSSQNVDEKEESRRKIASTTKKREFSDCPATLTFN